VRGGRPCTHLECGCNQNPQLCDLERGRRRRSAPHSPRSCSRFGKRQNPAKHKGEVDEQAEKSNLDCVCCCAAEPDTRPELAAALVNANEESRTCRRGETRLNVAVVARHHAGKDDGVPARGRPGVHVQSGRRGHKSTGTCGRAAEHDAHSLRGPISALRIVRARQRGMECRAALQEKPLGGGDELKWRHNLMAMSVRDDREPAEEEIVILEKQRFSRWVR
jgi:hypothetical protein